MANVAAQAAQGARATTRRRDFVWGGALAAAALVVSRSEFAQAAVAPSAADHAIVLDTIDGLLAFVVPGPDAHSVAQGMTSPTVGGVGLGIAAMLAATIDQTTPFVPHFSATVAATLNALASLVNAAALPTPAPPFASPFARLSFAEKAAVFQIMDGNEALKLLGGVLPPFVAFFCYSEAAAFDPATRTLTGQPVAWRLSRYQGVADGRDEFRGYLGRH